MPHSDLFQNYVNDGLFVPRDLQVFEYSELSDFLRELNDSYFGITSYFDEGNNAWVRDATSVKKEDRPLHDDLKIEVNNALLRVLSRLRPIEYAIRQHCQDKHKQVLRNEFLLLALSLECVVRNRFSRFSIDDIQDEILQLETAFNTDLLRTLHEAGLAIGIETKEDAEALLFHYRNLSSVLDDTRKLVTLSYDEQNHILHRQISHPVTKKTEQQHEEMKASLQSVIPYPLIDEKNAQTCQKVAFQMANQLFYDRLDNDHTMLPAQARKTHAIGAKNAFIEEVQLIHIDDEASLEEYQNTPFREVNTTKKTLILGRIASPAYLGKGETSENISNNAAENIQQVLDKARDITGDNGMRYHFISLNTDSSQEKQSTIIHHLKEAVKEPNQLSIIPVNAIGTFSNPIISHEILLENAAHRQPLQRASRVEIATEVALKASQDEVTLVIVQCASAQDRTGTVVEKTIENWMVEAYADTFGISGQEIPAAVETLRAQSGHSAEITTHLVHGSPGMKKESEANNFFGEGRTFSEAASAEFYRKSANTNKKNSVGDIRFLKTPSDFQKQAFFSLLEEASEEKFSVAQYPSGHIDKERKHREALHKEALHLRGTITKLAGYRTERNEEQFISASIRLVEPQKEKTKKFISTSISSKDLYDLMLALQYQIDGLKVCQDKEEAKKIARRLYALAKHCEGHPSSLKQTLASSLIFIAFLLLVATAVIAAVPTGGGSLALGLTLGLGLGSSLLLAGAAGALFFSNRQKGLSKAVKSLGSTLKDIEEPKDAPKDEPKSTKTRSMFEPIDLNYRNTDNEDEINTNSDDNESFKTLDFSYENNKNNEPPENPLFT